MKWTYLPEGGSRPSGLEPLQMYKLLHENKNFILNNQMQLNIRYDHHWQIYVNSLYGG